MAEERIPPTYLLKRVGEICFCLKCDDSMVTITPLRLVTIQLLTLQIQNEPINEPVNEPINEPVNEPVIFDIDTDRLKL